MAVLSSMFTFTINNVIINIKQINLKVAYRLIYQTNSNVHNLAESLGKIRVHKPWKVETSILATSLNILESELLTIN